MRPPILILSLLMWSVPVFGALGLEFNGQLSAVASQALSANGGQGIRTLRYLPRLKIERDAGAFGRLGFDASVDLHLTAPDENLQAHGRTYRLSLRYDTPRTQLRLGLQKINFGPARMLRVLQWFDELDPRDPLALSPGVWGLLGRVYLDNGINIRAWSLTDVEDPLREQLGKSGEGPLDGGGRVEIPIPRGTAGITLHRMDLGAVSGVQEDRMGLDLRLDALVGLWSETMLSRVQAPGMELERRALMLGSDYTLAVGNGIYVALEGMVNQGSSGGQKPETQLQSCAATATYTLGLEDGLSAFLYWFKQPGAAAQRIPMLGWQHTRGNWLLYLAIYDMPVMDVSTNSTYTLPAGTGVQLNIAFDH